MNILATQFSLTHKSLDIYISGCKGNPHCEGCHNPESWDFNKGNRYNNDYFINIENKVKEFDSLIENIMIFGGEPLDQEINELIHILIDLKTLNKKIWLFTRYDLDNIPNEIKALCNFIKCGRYIENMKCDDNINFGIKLATNNQKIYKKGVDY